MSTRFSGEAHSYGNSSVGRALVSKTRCREFEPLFPCIKNSYSMFKGIITYCKESYEELAYKTTWPTRRELTHTAIVVLVASIVIALMVFVMDTAFDYLMKFIYPTV